MQYYSAKEQKYFNNPRMDIIKLIPKRGNNKVLEIGAGGGDTLIEIKKQNIATEVVGVDLMHLKNTNQDNPLIDKFIYGNIENIDLGLPLNYFDIIICGDVLEHLIDPWKTLKNLYRYLKSDGIIITSIPNIREIQTLYKIVVKADFGYEEKGILDKTHLRFFCKKNILSLLKEASFESISVNSSFDTIGVSSIRKLSNQLTLGLFRDFLTIQYIIVAKKIIST